MSERFFHRTDNIHKILDSGRVGALKHIARNNPTSVISVEPGARGRNLGGLRSAREDMTASDAYEAMRGVKDTDSVFLTKDTLPPETYGKYVIEKRLKSPKFNTKLNLIPNEYRTGRELSLRNNAIVYVPDDELEPLRNTYSGVNFMSNSDLDARKAGIVDRARTLYGKLSKKASIDTLYSGSESDVRRILSPNATIVGSEGLGLALPGSSDRDILVPYKTKAGYNRIVSKLKENGFGLQESPYNDRKREGYKVYSYKDDDYDVDVAVVHGGKSSDLAKFVRDFRINSSDEYKQSLIDRKQKASNAWLFRDYRYKKVKKGIDREIGITQYHE